VNRSDSVELRMLVQTGRSTRRAIASCDEPSGLERRATHAAAVAQRQASQPTSGYHRWSANTDAAVRQMRGQPLPITLIDGGRVLVSILC
jgi:hypothetical protein